MKTKLMIGLGLAFIALAALIPMPAAAGQLFPVMAFSFSPAYYSAEWPPWDLSSDYYSAEWAPWDSWDMSRLGWGYDSGYGGYGGGTLYDTQTPGKEYFIGPDWWRNHGYKGHDDTFGQGARARTEPSRAKVVSVIAKPPVTLVAIQPMREPKDSTEPGLRGSERPNRPSGTWHGRKHDEGTEPASVSGSRQHAQRPSASVNTWDEIIAGCKARGRDWPPAYMTNSDKGHASTGSAGSKGYYQAPTKPNTAAPSFSSGSGKQK